MRENLVKFSCAEAFLTFDGLSS